tara:strand:- start:235 stop:621 length:387 start_codon:yes stop_codon:yes gene_type:complete
MRNFKNNRRRFRNNSFERNLKINSADQGFVSNLGNVSDFKKKNYYRNNTNSAKLIQKYSDLAREALSSGDKILYENYLQHAEHFVRISENFSNSNSEKNLSVDNLNDTSISKISKVENKKSQVIAEDN